MKILLFFTTVCTVIQLEACLCGKAEGAQGPCLATNKSHVSRACLQRPHLSSIGTLTNFFESLYLINKRQTQADADKSSLQIRLKKQSPHGKHVFLENEDACHKELRGKFERGDFDHLYGSYKDLSAVIVEPPTIDESEECVTQRVIKSLMPGKVFSKEQAREYYDFIGCWRACIETYGIEIPKDYFVACRYLEKLLGKKN